MIRDAVITQKRELEGRLAEDYVERDADLSKFSNNLIKVVTGPRRAGKSFFASHTLRKLGSFGYVNFDDERFTGLKDYDDIVNAVDSVYGNPKTILFDEIQNLGKWELFVNRLQRQGRNLVITGSNANLLGRELATHLTGRHLPLTILPFSFKEFLMLDGRQLTESEVGGKLSDYLTFGGFPEPHVKGIGFRSYLTTLFDSIVYKDIVKRFKVRGVQGIDDLATYLASNTAREYSFNTLSKVTGVRSVNTVEKYLRFLKEAFIFFKLSRFSFKVREQLSSGGKIYCIDNGFIHAKAFKTSPDEGRLMENTVAVELRKLQLNGVADVYYWKSKRQEEVDFVIKQGLKITQLIQVCRDISDPKTRKREVNSLLKASKILSCKNLQVITRDRKGEEQAEWYGIKRKIKFTPLADWLLRKHQP